MYSEQEHSELFGAILDHPTAVRSSTSLFRTGRVQFVLRETHPHIVGRQGYPELQYHG
jgi:hypothetical protein